MIHLMLNSNEYLRYRITGNKSGINGSEKLAYKKIKTQEKNIFLMPKNEYAQKLVPI